MDALTYVTLDDTGSQDYRQLPPDDIYAVRPAGGASDTTDAGVRIHNGFPNPAAERNTQPLSLDRLLVQSPCSTYFMRVSGHSWHRLGIYDGDIAVVDRARTPTPDATVVSYTDTGELVLCKWSSNLFASNPMGVWGVVTAIVHQYTNFTP